MKHIIRNLFLVVSLQCRSLETLTVGGKSNWQTAGLSCKAVLASYSQILIPNTQNLNTGTFYRISMKYPRVDNDGGWLNWASRKDSAGANLVFSDYNNLGMYEKGAPWYHDTYWAFLTTTTAGWYHVINCAYPQKYLTWSMNATLSEPSDVNGYPLVIDERYPGIHSKEDFLFKPVYISNENSYLLMQKSFNLSIVSESDSRYSGESYWMKVVANSEWHGTKYDNDNPCNTSLFMINDPMNENLQEETKADSSIITSLFVNSIYAFLSFI